MRTLAISMSDWLNVSIFTFLIVKIVIQRQLYQQLVKSIVYMYYWFFACKNHNMTIVVSSQLYVSIFVFPPTKIITLRQLCQQLVRPIIYMYFCFFACENHNMETAVLAAN